MNFKLILLTFVFSVHLAINSNAQIPLVYEVENTGATCDQPPLPAPKDLQNYPFLPDPFAWSDGCGRVQDFSDW